MNEKEISNMYELVSKFRETGYNKLWFENDGKILYYKKLKENNIVSLDYYLLDSNFNILEHNIMPLIKAMFIAQMYDDSYKY